MPFHFRTAFLTLIAVLLPPLASAAELKLQNGDRISGEILKAEGGKVHLRSDIFGEIAIPEDKVVSISKMENHPAEVVLPVSGGVGSLIPKSSGPALGNSVKDRWAHFRKNVKGSIDFGLNDQSGRSDSINMSFYADAEYERKSNNFRIEGRYYYSQSDGVMQSDKRDLGFRWRRQLNKDFFSQILTSYGSDRPKSIDVNLEESVGIGYSAINREQHKLNVGLGGTAQYRYAFGTETGTVAMGDIFQDYSLQISKRLVLKQDAAFQYSPVDRMAFTYIDGKLVPANAEAANYRLRFNATLQGKLTERLTLNFRYEYEFDNTIMDPELKADQRIISAIGFTF